MINDILTLKPDDEIPPYASRCIDVRDVAKAHLVAFEKEEAINQRLVLINQPFSNDLVAYIIKKSFPISIFRKAIWKEVENALQNRVSNRFDKDARNSWI